MREERSTQYFAALEQKLQAQYGDWSRFRIKICGRVVELCFPDEAMCQPATRSLHGFLTEEAGEPDATFFYWNDQCEPYTVQGMAGMPGEPVPRLFAHNPEKNHFYYVQPTPPDDDYMVHGRTTVFHFSRWASANDLVMIHAATVGVDGKGVLIVGRSGSGKTTFAISCLMAGLEFVSDDYTLLSASGTLQAMPLYTMVGVTQEIYRKFPALETLSVLPPKVLNNGKMQAIIPARRFSGKLDIKAIILPVIHGKTEVALKPVPPGRAMIHLLHSSAVQTGREQDTALIRQIAQRLAGVPVYEMHMSTELEKNPAALRDFLRQL